MCSGARRCCCCCGGGNDGVWRAAVSGADVVADFTNGPLWPDSLHVDSIAVSEDVVALVVSAEPDGWQPDFTLTFFVFFRGISVSPLTAGIKERRICFVKSS